jgi:hypothetical protein
VFAAAASTLRRPAATLPLAMPVLPRAGTVRAAPSQIRYAPDPAVTMVPPPALSVQRLPSGTVDLVRQYAHDKAVEQVPGLSRFSTGDGGFALPSPTEIGKQIKQQAVAKVTENVPMAGLLLAGQGTPQQQTGTPAEPPNAALDTVPSGESLEALAQRLVTPLTRLLRNELRLDRERAGRLRDSSR